MGRRWRLHCAGGTDLPGLSQEEPSDGCHELINECERRIADLSIACGLTIRHQQEHVSTQGPCFRAKIQAVSRNAAGRRSH